MLPQGTGGARFGRWLARSTHEYCTAAYIYSRIVDLRVFSVHLLDNSYGFCRQECRLYFQLTVDDRFVRLSHLHRQRPIINLQSRAVQIDHRLVDFCWWQVDYIVDAYHFFKSDGVDGHCWIVYYWYELSVGNLECPGHSIYRRWNRALPKFTVTWLPSMFVFIHSFINDSNSLVV